MLRFIRIGRSGAEFNAVAAPARPGSRRGAPRRGRSPHIEVLETRLTPSGIPTTIQISSSVPTAVIFDTVVFTAVVTSTQGTPTGSVAFYQYDVRDPNGVLVSTQPVDGQGHASFSTIFVALDRGSDPGQSFDVSAVYLPGSIERFRRQRHGPTGERDLLSGPPPDPWRRGPEQGVRLATHRAPRLLPGGFLPQPPWCSNIPRQRLPRHVQRRVASFASGDVGTGVPVTVSGLSITGGDAATYRLVQPTGLTTDIAPPALAGTWFTNGNQATQVRQNGSRLTFTDASGDVSPGTFVDPAEPTQVVATAWGDLVGTVVTTAAGMQIDWANGTRWEQPPTAGSAAPARRPGVHQRESGRPDHPSRHQSHLHQ